MKSTRFSFLSRIAALSLVLFTAIAFNSCNDPTEETELSPYGTWYEASYYTTYEITQDYFKNYGVTYDSYEGEDVSVKRLTSDSGYIYFKYTKAFEAVFTQPEDLSSWTSSWTNGENTVYTDPNDDSYTYYGYRYSETAPDVGKYYAVYYSDLTSSSIKLSAAYPSQSGHDATSTETLEEAIAEFTVENGYFTYSSSCVLK